ncbi:positive regulation of protein localization to ciliary membrane [Mactra antiquata]
MSYRRSSQQTESSSELFLECKAAFLSIFDSISDKIESKTKLLNVLQQSGRNPTRSSMNKYWSKGTEELTFDDFVDICRKEPVTTADDLMKAFRKIDINGDGYISLDELYKIMSKKGEGMTRDEVRKMIDEVDDNSDGKLDYRETSSRKPVIWREKIFYDEFTNMIMKTTEEAKQFSMKVMQKKEQKKKRGDRQRDKESKKKDEDDSISRTESIGHEQSGSGYKSKSDDQSAKSSSSKDSPRVSPRNRPDSASRQRSNSGGRARSDSNSKQGVKKGTTPRETPRRDSKDTPRRDSSARSEKPPLPDSPRSKDDKAKTSKIDKPTTPKDSSNSARSVGEEIHYDDDFDIVSTGRPTPRIDLNAKGDPTPRTENKEDLKKSDREETSSKSGKEAKDENSLGSQTSLRSDEVPKPSPRIKRDGKSKSKTKDGLPDPKSLRDWHHFTSKGCFFYEEDEIVSHIFSLKLTQDSTVYLSAHPIDEPACLNLPSSEPIDTVLYIFDSDGRLETSTEIRDSKGTYGVKCDLRAGSYQVLPYTTGCRFKQRPEGYEDTIRESKLVKTKDGSVAITSAFRKALEDIFDLCDLDGNGTMSKDEFNWFNLRTSGEELGEDEWEVVEDKTDLENGEITKQGFIELNEMEAEDAQGDVEDLWITLTSMGMNKGLIMDEACPYKIDVYIEEIGSRKPNFKVTGIESLENKNFSSEICQHMIEKATDSKKIRNMKDLYMYTYKTDLKAAIILDNRSRSNVSVEVDCRRSKNVVSNRSELDYTIDIDPQTTAIAQYLIPKSEIEDWTVSCTESIKQS